MSEAASEAHEASAELESPEAAARRGARDAYLFGKPPEHLPSHGDPAPRRVTPARDVTIERLDFSKRRDRARFIDCAARFYVGEPHYIAPLRMQLEKFLDPKKNPAYENLEVQPFVAVRRGEIVGRITAHYDRAYAAYHEVKTGFFGFFECIDDPRVAHALFDEAMAWCKARGAVEVFGPMNYTMSHQVGLLVQNFDRPPFVEETFNPRYYQDLVESYGFAKAKDWYAWWIELAEGMDTEKRRRIARIAEKVKKRENVEIRHIDFSKPHEEIKKLYALYMACWQKNWSFVPLSEREFAWLAEDMQQIALPELIFFVEVDKKPVGFCATLPNINEVLPRDGKLFPFGWTKLLFGGLKKTTTGRLYTLGMLPEYRKRGLETLMFSLTVENAKKVGYTAGEIGLTLEDNVLINRAIEAMDGTLDRIYRIYGMKL